MKKAAGYLRCSTEMQDQSIAQQKKSIETWGAKNDMHIVEWFEDEGKSGTNFENRPAFMDLVRRIEMRPDFEFVLVYDESRWGRAGNPRESNYWKVHCEKRGVKVRVINSMSNNQNDIGSYVVEVVESAESSEYSKKLSRSTLRGCIDNASKGFSNGGTSPYGYRRVAISKSNGNFIRELKPGEWSRSGDEKVAWDIGNDDEVKVVQKIFEMRISGYGFRSIAEALNVQGIPCAKRGKWRNKNQMWSAGTIQSIATNPSYCGDRVYNRHPLSKKKINEINVLGVSKDRWISNESEWTFRRDAHPAIVSREVFERANQLRMEKGKTNQHHYESPYLLSGLVRCERCGFNYQGQSYRAANKFYYVDGGNMNKGKSVCSRLSIRKEKLEGYVTSIIKEILPFSKKIDLLEELISKYLETRTNENLENASVEKQLSENYQRISNLLALVEDGVERETVLARIKDLEKEKFRLESVKRTNEKRDQPKFNPKIVAREAADFLLNFEQKFDTAPIQEKKELLRRLVVGVSINPEKRIATCSITKIPMVTRMLTSLVNPSGLLGLPHHVGAYCSGGRT